MALLLMIGQMLSADTLSTAIGMILTFFALILLAYNLYLIKKLHIKDDKKELPSTTTAVINQDDATIAAITAAVAIILDEESAAQKNKPRASFIVKSIKRI